MEIKTKFKIGDRVYPIKRYYTGDYRYSKYRIADMGSMIIRFISVGGNNQVIYSNAIRSEFFEHDCFATQDEAQKECDLRNGK